MCACAMRSICATICPTLAFASARCINGLSEALRNFGRSDFGILKSRGNAIASEALPEVPSALVLLQLLQLQSCNRPLLRGASRPFNNNNCPSMCTAMPPALRESEGKASSEAGENSGPLHRFRLTPHQSLNIFFYAKAEAPEPEKL